MKRNYFDDLNYTLGNEDSSLEFTVLPRNTNHILAIAGSGSRILPLLAKHPKQLTCIDTSSQQLYLTELRIETLRSLEYDKFLAFWGYPTHSLAPEERKKVFHGINLSKATYSYLNNLFKENKWESLLYLGRWERTFITLSKINKLITGKKASGLFYQKSTKEYFSYLKNNFPHKALAFVVFILGNASVFNALLYKGRFPKKNIPGTMPKFYLKAFNRLFNQGLARNNFFLQLLFFGKLIFPEGNPIECDKKIFNLAKIGVNKAKIIYLRGNIIERITKIVDSIDFISFSDVPSYFTGEVEKNYLQDIYPYLSPHALVVIRYYLHIPEGAIMKGYKDISENYSDQIDKEKVQMYLIKILSKQL